MEEIIKASTGPKAITPFDKEMTEKLNKVEFKVESKRDIEFITNRKAGIDEILK